MYSDQELILMTLKGRKDSFDEIVDRYFKMVYGLCLRMLKDRSKAEDLTQEAFLRAYRSLDMYRSEYSFANWLLKITSNLCLDDLRKKEAVFCIDGTLMLNTKPQCTFPDPESTLIYGEMLAKTEDLLSDLPEKYQLVLFLRFVEDLKYEQIAEILDVPIGTVKTQLHRARKLMKERYFAKEKAGEKYE